MSQALRKLSGAISQTNTCCIFINQLRQKIGVMFGPSEVTTGGLALKYYASVRLDVRRLTSLKDGDQVLGNRVSVKVVKNKVAPPFLKTEFDLIFGVGIDRMAEVLDLALEGDIIKKSGSFYRYDGSPLAQGRSATIQMLRDTPELAAEIEARVRNIGVVIPATGESEEENTPFDPD